MEEALVARILAAAGVSALIGTRAYWNERPQNSALSAVVLQNISPGRNYHHGGADNLSTPRVQINCLGATYSAAKLLARAMIAALEPSATVSSIKFNQAFLDSEGDLPVQSLPSGKVFGIRQDFFIWWEPAS